MRASKRRATLERSFRELFKIRRKRRVAERSAAVEEADADRLGVADQRRRFERFTFREDAVPKEDDGGGNLDVAQRKASFEGGIADFAQSRPELDAFEEITFLERARVDSFEGVGKLERFESGTFFKRAIFDIFERRG